MIKKNPKKILVHFRLSTDIVDWFNKTRAKFGFSGERDQSAFLNELLEHVKDNENKFLPKK